MFLHWQAGGEKLSTFFINQINYNTDYVYVKYLETDTNGNIYLAFSVGALQSYIMKLSSEGVVLWQKSWTSPNDISAIQVDASGNVYGVYRYGGGNINVFKLNSSGVKQWARGYDISGLSGSDASFIYDMKIDSTGANIYLVGRMNFSVSSSYQSALLVKIDSAGTLQYQRRFGGSTTENHTFTSVGLDSSNNLYIRGTYFDSTTSTNKNIFLKYNSSGTVQWQYSTTAGVGLPQISVDNSGNCFFTEYSTQTVSIPPNTPVNDQSVPNLPTLVKTNSSGTLQWTAVMYQQNSSASPTAYVSAGAPTGLCLDSLGNIYLTLTSNDLVGFTSPSTATDVAVFKFDSAGSNQWSRLLESSRVISSNTYNKSVSKSIVNDNLDNVLLLSYFGLNTDPEIYPKLVLSKLPSDGSKTATYTPTEATYIYRDPTYYAEIGTSISLTTTTTTDSSVTLSNVTITATFSDSSVPITQLVI